jgi:hypothetical protein
MSISMTLQADGDLQEDIFLKLALVVPSSNGWNLIEILAVAFR